MIADLFQFCGHFCVFQICWHKECSILTAPSYRIWNNSTEILSHPLGLFIVMLPKTHLTSHCRMSGSRWVITPSWLSGSWRSFLYSSSVYYCQLLISSTSVRSIPFLSFIVTIFDSFLYLCRGLCYTDICLYEILCNETLNFLHFITFNWTDWVLWNIIHFQNNEFLSHGIFIWQLLHFI